VHEGTLVIRGTYSAGFELEHADGTAYGEAAASPARAALLAQVLAALVGMGWKQRDAQAMVDRAKPHVGRDTTPGEAMRAALRGAPRQVREELAA
jgi:Holliday junction resolvasome RuvABC DNA-binding subunit